MKGQQNIIEFVTRPWLNLEVAKNLVLAGVNSMTVMDHEPLTKEDFDSQFLAPRDKLGTNRAEASLERLQGSKAQDPIFYRLSRSSDKVFCNFFSILIPFYF